MNAVTFISGSIAVLALLPAIVVFVQVVAAAVGTRVPMPGNGRRPRLAVLVPAHNEARVITPTLRSIVPQLAAGDRLLVIADNCTDDTARVAAAEGALVAERNDLSARGKTHALQFGIRKLAADPPEVVVIVDADCEVAIGAVDTLARCCQDSNRPSQALYLMRAPAGAELGIRIAAFGWILRNWVRPLGMHALRLPCLLTGSGMAIPWSLSDRLLLSGSAVAEDYKASVEMTMAGSAPVFCPEAKVASEFPARPASIETQRTRWEHGHLALVLSEVPRLIGAGLRRRDVNCLALAVDLAVPPLALLALILALALGLALGSSFFDAGQWPLALAAAAALLLGLSVMAAWIGWGRGTVSLADLAAAPAYAIRKLPLYARFITRRQREWIKTERD